MGNWSEIESTEGHANRGGHLLVMQLQICVALLLVPLVASCAGSDSSSAEPVTSAGPAAATVEPPETTAKLPDTTASATTTGSGNTSEVSLPPDRDGDGVPDDQDNCPDDENPEQNDVCGSTIPPTGGCARTATLFFARPKELTRPVLVVEFSNSDGGGSKSECGEGIPNLRPPKDAFTIAASPEAVYLLASEGDVAAPGGGVEVSDAVFDGSVVPKQITLRSSDLSDVLVGSLAGPQAKSVAAALAPSAEKILPARTWQTALQLNRALDAAADPKIAPAGSAGP